MPFKLFEFLERYMIGAFMITLTQLEKTGSTFVFGECYLRPFQQINFN